MKIGVIGLQGAITEHLEMVERAMEELGIDGDATWLNTKDQIENVEGLIVPGGESTTIGRLMKNSGIFEKVKEEGKVGKPILGTCAGLILLAKEGGSEIKRTEQPLLKLMDIKVKRNAFGGQRESFETELNISVLGEKPFRGVFIRAPAIEKVGENVKVLAKYKGMIVAAEQGNLLSVGFHPELTSDTRIHEYFLEKVRKKAAE